MKTLAAFITFAIILAAVVARAEDGSQTSDQSSSNGSSFTLAMTIGEVLYFIESDVHRGPVSLELVPSVGWPVFKFDFGLYTTLESVRIHEANVGLWNFTFRPGARLTPTTIPLYLRAAVPLVFYEDDFDWGLMFGVGADINIVSILGLVLEVDTTLSKNLEWGNLGVPLEFRAGVSLSF